MSISVGMQPPLLKMSGCAPLTSFHRPTAAAPLAPSRLPSPAIQACRTRPVSSTACRRMTAYVADLRVASGCLLSLITHVARHCVKSSGCPLLTLSKQLLMLPPRLLMLPPRLLMLPPRLLMLPLLQWRNCYSGADNGVRPCFTGALPDAAGAQGLLRQSRYRSRL